MARRQIVSKSSDFEVDQGADWKPVTLIYEVLNRRIIS